MGELIRLTHEVGSLHFDCFSRFNLSRSSQQPTISVHQAALKTYPITVECLSRKLKRFQLSLSAEKQDPRNRWGYASKSRSVNSFFDVFEEYLSAFPSLENAT